MIAAEKYIALLLQMLEIPSLSRDEAARANFLESWLRQERFYVKRISNKTDKFPTASAHSLTESNIRSTKITSFALKEISYHDRCLGHNVIRGR